MKVKNFNYKKNDEAEEKKVFIFNESEKYLEGIDLQKLNEEEQKQFIAIQSDYISKIEPFVKKAFRKYLKEKIEGDVLKEEINE